MHLLGLEYDTLCFWTEKYQYITALKQSTNGEFSSLVVIKDAHGEHVFPSGKTEFHSLVMKLNSNEKLFY